MASTVGTTYYVTKGKATNAVQTFRNMPTEKPRRIRVINLSNEYVAEWNEALAEDEALVFNAGDPALVTTNGFKHVAGDSSNPPGWQMGVLPNINDTTTENLIIETWK